MKTTISRIIYIIVVLVIIKSLFFLANEARAGWFSDSHIDKLTAGANKTNSKLPRTLDKNTRWDNVSVVGNTLVNRYSVNNDLENKNNIEGWRTYLQKKLDNQYCTNPDLKPLREYNIYARRQYNFVNGVHFLTVSTNNTRCK